MVVLGLLAGVEADYEEYETSQEEHRREMIESCCVILVMKIPPGLRTGPA
jgi:hypothetical protein